MTDTNTTFDTVGFIMAFEAGDIEDEQEVIEGFQELIDSGVVWQLQGSYGRMAARLIEAGYCFRPGERPQGPYLRALIDQHNPPEARDHEFDSCADCPDDFPGSPTACPPVCVMCGRGPEVHRA